MKVLYVTYHYLQGNGGGIFCSRGYINAFSALSEEMTLLYPVKEGRPAEGLSGSMKMNPVSYGKTRFGKYLDLLVGKVHRFFGIFDKVLASGDFDTVVFDSCYASFRLIDKAQRAGCRTIVLHHNYQCEYVRDNYRFPLRLPMLFWTRRAEREAVLRCDVNLVVTESDRQMLQRQYDPGKKASFHVTGVFEYSPAAESVLPAPVEEPVYVLTGNLSMLQTEIPLLEWLEELHPVLMEEDPQAHVIVAGKGPTTKLLAKCREKEVEVVDTPPDMQAVLCRGRYYLCPTSLGGGLKLRIMDGLRNGMPVLTHSVSARGYEPFLGRFVFEYTDAESFRRSLRAMRELKVDREGIVQAYRKVFSLEAGMYRLRKALS